MKTICFAQMKGGTGKTTLSYNISSLLAENKKVLAIDFDAQCNLSSNFGFNAFEEGRKTVATILEDINTDPLDVVIPSPIEELPTLDLLPCTMYFYGTELVLISRMSREFAMKSYMEQHADFFNYYDYVIFDTAPSMGIINQNAYVCADHIVLVTDPDCNSAMGAHVFLKLWDDARKYSKIPNKVDGLVLNNVERTQISDKTRKYLNEHPVLSAIKYNTVIPHTTRFKECAEQNKPIQYIKTRNKATEISRKKAENSMLALIDEMKERGTL